ncbi:uncharacterized protein ColSpa_10920 [Colletotrichum spaethianum]|uniref:FAS1 domain-containing protein n=1 Tax=Colletotrichum spaethianum TaxID=700344 RepID=A0AA37PEI6_9PEZI|nr:uncharacterized protein ColSpa_10920 [Colletotrichum spaethianum]GKT50739.1 hypothetical protein ColSpa_10920 [Colletotrichum spaethianum]
MKFSSILSILVLGAGSVVHVTDRNPLSYVPKPEGTYVPQRTPNITTLLDFVKSRSDLATFTKILNRSAGFLEAFDTPPAWDSTLFASSDTALVKHTKQYFNT